MLLRVYAPDKEGKQELVMRAYTPTTADETLGCFYLVVKIYYANVHPRFPDGGRMSQVCKSPVSECRCF
jgi:nitrate reductase (NAD(P)H)